MIVEVKAYFESKHKLFYKKDVDKLEDCWTKCITHKRDYVDG